jgi:outer membrane protein OmpA-like peptidoglycan-associated protein
VFCLTAWTGSAPAQADKDAVNEFYSQFRKADVTGATLREKVLMVNRDRAAADKCLAMLKLKMESSPENKEAATALYGKLEEALLLAAKAKTCSNEVIGKLFDGYKNARENEDKIIFLEKVVQLCPTNVEAYYPLGDLYLKERQFGMAVDSYKKGLNIRKSRDVEDRMKVAKELLDEYRSGKKIDVAAVQDLFGSSNMGPAPGHLAQDIEIRRALQTNSIKFEPWSSQIDQGYTAEVEAVGKVMKAYGSDPKIGLLIEGHADGRGEEAKNLEISEDRAKAVKDFIVKRYGIDAARIQAKGYGFYKPVAPNDTPENMRLNRRVEFKKIEF